MGGDVLCIVGVGSLHLLMEAPEALQSHAYICILYIRNIRVGSFPDMDPEILYWYGDYVCVCVCVPMPTGR